MKTTIKKVEKKEIKFLKFPKEDVLSNKAEKLNRFVKLHRALYLDNLKDDKKVNITFFDDMGLKIVETAISGITDKLVILKKSTIIPLARIVSVA